MAWQEFRDCPVCGNEMLTWRETQLTCSKKCQGELARLSRDYPVDEWGQKYLAGASYRQIADEYGVSYAVVRRNVQHAGYPARSATEHLKIYQQRYAWRAKS